MKTCARCKMALDTTQERHVRIEDKNGKDVISKLYYHRECWKEIMRGKADMHNLNTEAMGMIKDIKKMIGTKEEFHID